MPVRPFHAASVAALTATVLVVAAARADVPDPRFCTADPAIVAAPAGAPIFRVTLRDAANQPIVGVAAILDFNASVGITLCPTADVDRDGRIVALTGVTGVAEFAVPAGGTSPTPVKVSTVSFDVTTVTFTSYDLDGDLDVDVDDRAALVAQFGTSGPVGDYNGDAAVNAADQALLDAAFGSVCGAETPPPPPPVEPGHSWGGVKAIYR